MGKYILRRILQMIPVLIGATFIIYTLVWGLPGDPFAGRCGNRPCPDAYIEAMNEKYNLNDPFYISYIKYLGNMLTGNFGETYNGLSVAQQVASGTVVTLKLSLIAVLFEGIIGIGAGILAGLRRGGFMDNLVLLSTLIVISIPIFVIGVVLQLFLGMKWGIFPATAAAGAPWGSLILPGFVLGSVSLAYIARLVRTSLVEHQRADYARTAASKGMTRQRVVGVHVLRNTMIPVVTFIGADLGSLLGGAIITEGIFGINGLGGKVFNAIQTQEALTVTTIVTLFVLFFLVMNLIVDILYAWLDPRIRYD